MTQPARTLTDADVAAIADRLAYALVARMPHVVRRLPARRSTALEAYIRVGRISEPPQASGIYAACIERGSGECGPQWRRGDFYVGLGVELDRRLGHLHGRWNQIHDARAVFLVVENPGSERLRETLAQCEGAVERKLSALVHTVNAAETRREWSPEIDVIAEEAVRACLALRAEVLS